MIMYFTVSPLCRHLGVPVTRDVGAADPARTSTRYRITDRRDGRARSAAVEPDDTGR
jgi:hypothetical protein